MVSLLLVIIQSSKEPTAVAASFKFFIVLKGEEKIGGVRGVVLRSMGLGYAESEAAGATIEAPGIVACAEHSAARATRSK